MAFGADVGLALVEPLREDPALASYPFLPSVRAELLSQLGRYEEAAREIERAASLSQNARQRAMFLERAAAYGAANAEREASRDTGFSK